MDLLFGRISGAKCPRCGNGYLLEVTALATTGEAYTGRLCARCIEDGVSAGARLVLSLQESLDATPRRGTRPVSRARRRAVARQEAEAAEAISGRVQPGSGTGAHAKSDARAKGRFRVECKSTTRNSFTITLDLLDKVRGEARGLEVPVLDIKFLDPQHTEIDRWVTVPWQFFQNVAAK